MPEWAALEAGVTSTLAGGSATTHVGEPDPFSIDMAVADGEDLLPGADRDLDVLARGGPPSSGMVRRAVRWLTGRPGSAAEPLAEEIARLRAPLSGSARVAVVSTKGGVGKTTTTVNLGHTLATFRGDRVIAVDANPDAGSLGHRVPRQTDATIADLLAAEDLSGFGSIGRFTSQAASRLEVLASTDDPRQNRALGRDDYVRLLDELTRHYTLVLVDCGTGILDGATRGVVQSSDQLVVVTAPSIDSARAVTHLLRWLAAHRMRDAVRNAIVVVNGVREPAAIDVQGLVEHFAALVAHVCPIPFDRELSSGGETSPDHYDPATRDAYLRLAVALIDRLRA